MIIELMTVISLLTDFIKKLNKGFTSILLTTIIVFLIIIIYFFSIVRELNNSVDLYKNQIKEYKEDNKSTNDDIKIDIYNLEVKFDKFNDKIESKFDKYGDISQREIKVSRDEMEDSLSNHYIKRVYMFYSLDEAKDIVNKVFETYRTIEVIEKPKDENDYK